MNISQDSIQKIMSEAILIQKHCTESCFDFQVMTSRFHKDTLILRWVEVDISDVERPIQSYRYRCFYLDGTSQNCSIHYTNVEQANTFFKSLEGYDTQDFTKG